MSRVACRVRRLRPRLLLALSENEVLAAGQMPDADQGFAGGIGTSVNHLLVGPICPLLQGFVLSCLALMSDNIEYGLT